jgi:hypothetical protein
VNGGGKGREKRETQRHERGCERVTSGAEFMAGRWCLSQSVSDGTVVECSQIGPCLTPREALHGEFLGSGCFLILYWINSVMRKLNNYRIKINMFDLDRIDAAVLCTYFKMTETRWSVAPSCDMHSSPIQPI